MKNNLIAFSGFFFLLLLWETVSRLTPDLAFVLPPPSKILLCFLSKKERFLFHTSVTCQEMAGGFLLALVIAFPLAWGMALWSSVRYFLEPLFVLIQCIPMFTLAPIMVLWFDWSFTAIIVPTALMIFFPLTMNIYQGICSTPTHFLHYFQRHKATRLQTLLKLQLPWAMPHIFAGFRISAAVAGIGAVAGEWAGGQAGLGVLMLESRRAADLETTFAALFCLTALSLTLYLITKVLETKVRFYKAVIPLLLAMMTLGCQSSQKPMKLALDWLPNPNHIPLFVGVEKGIFEKHGISLQLQKLHDPSDSLPFLTTGQTDFALTYMPHTLHALSHGAKITPIAILIQEPLNALLYRKGEGIFSPHDLTGKNVGFCVDGTETEVLDWLLSTNRIDPKQTRNVSFDLVTMLGTKRVDALYGAYWNIEGEHLRSMGIETDYFKLTDLGLPNYYELIVVAKEGISLDLKERFQFALQESIDAALENPEEAFAIYLQANPDKSQKTLDWERKAWEKTLSAFATTQEIDKEEWNAFASWIAKFS